MSSTATGIAFPSGGGGEGLISLAIMSRQRTEINEMAFLTGTAEKKIEPPLTSTLIIYIILISLCIFLDGWIHMSPLLFYRSSLTRQPPQSLVKSPPEHRRRVGPYVLYPAALEPPQVHIRTGRRKKGSTTSVNLSPRLIYLFWCVFCIHVQGRTYSCL